MRGRWSQTGWSEAGLGPPSLRWGLGPRLGNASGLRAVGGYALLATLATALALALRDGPPWVYPDPWLNEPPLVSLASSALLGLTVALAIIVLTRFTVKRFAWAQQLHNDLRPVARDLTIGQILVIAGLSSLGEELLFRGLLVPTVGVPLAGVLFGLAHQIKGPSRWVWAGWATSMGLVLGAVFAATGSLVGPLLAHAIVNATNLTFLRDHDPAY